MAVFVLAALCVFRVSSFARRSSRACGVVRVRVVVCVFVSALRACDLHSFICLHVLTCCFSVRVLAGRLLFYCKFEHTFAVFGG